MTFIPWHNEELYPVKRALSQYEKSSLLDAHLRHRALILPGSPGTEVEELIKVGFGPRQIIALERDPTLARALFTHYVDEVQVIQSELYDAIPFLRGTYSYVHLDFCGMLNDHEIACIERIRRVVASEARLRVTLTRARKTPVMEKRERDLLLDSLGQLIFAARSEDLIMHHSRWIHIYDAIFDTEFDPATALIGTMFICNYFFRCSVFDVVCQHENVPELGDEFACVTRLHRFHYLEPHSKTPMSTLYADIERWPLATSGQTRPWVLDRFYQMCELVARPATTFSL